ncbi:MAG: TetR/AcrR family transcriptional regulator [Gammaproteobacteria bacterium]|nr:TetR/AcrR family transcriptional regulator [Gammaproteobacteria bacterium]
MRESVGNAPPPDTPTPGRPRRFDTAAVLESALELFWKRGYHTTTTRELERYLGVNQSSLYNVFGTKQALLDAALDRYETLTTGALLGPLEDSESGLQAIEKFFSDLAHWVTRDGRRGCMLINMMAEDGTATESIKRRTRDYRKRVKLALKDSLQRAVANGEVAVDDLDQRASLLLGMVLGYNIAARGGASKQELQALLGAVNAQLSSWRCAQA